MCCRVWPPTAAPSPGPPPPHVHDLPPRGRGHHPVVAATPLHPSFPAVVAATQVVAATHTHSQPVPCMGKRRQVHHDTQRHTDRSWPGTQCAAADPPPSPLFACSSCASCARSRLSTRAGKCRALCSAGCTQGEPGIAAMEAGAWLRWGFGRPCEGGVTFRGSGGGAKGSAWAWR